MSLTSDSGAKSAAQEIIRLIEKELAAAQNQETVAVLKRIKAKAEEILKAAESGWY